MRIVCSEGKPSQASGTFRSCLMVGEFQCGNQLSHRHSPHVDRHSLEILGNRAGGRLLIHEHRRVRVKGQSCGFLCGVTTTTNPLVFIFKKKKKQAAFRYVRANF